MRWRAVIVSVFVLTTQTLTSIQAPAQDLSPVEKHGQLRVEGQFLRDQHGEKVILRGQSLGWSTWWPQYWNADVVEWVANDWKIDVIRAAMGVDTNPGYLNDSARKSDLVRTVVNAAIANGIYVIIDWHAHNMHLDAALGFFTAMAQEFGSHPNVIYELYNEPVNETWAEIKAYSDTLIKAIRRYDPNNIIIVTPTNYAQNVDEAANAPLLGHENIMYSFHFYADGHKEPLRVKLRYAISKGLPIFVTESSGMWYTGDGPINYVEWWAYLNLMEANYISWINWSISDKRETCSVLLPGASVAGGWGDDELNESGKFIRWLLRSHKVPTVRVDTLIVPENLLDVRLKVGDTLQLVVDVLPEDAANRAIDWRSSHTNRVEVDKNGKVTARGKGSATIRAIAQDRALVAQINIIVEEVTSAEVMPIRDRIYPNPTHGYLNIYLDSPKAGQTIQIYSTVGKKLLELPINSNSVGFDMSGFSAGIYLLKIGNKDNVQTHRIMRL